MHGPDGGFINVFLPLFSSIGPDSEALLGLDTQLLLKEPVSVQLPALKGFFSWGALPEVPHSDLLMYPVLSCEFGYCSFGSLSGQLVHLKNSVECI